MAKDSDESTATLSIDAFVRSIGVNKLTSHLLFLGAGASVTSGIPSAQTAVWEWKRRIFLTNHPGLEDQFAELSLEAVREKIQRWLDKQGAYPPSGSPEEYGVFIEACYPIAYDRRAFFQEQVRTARPHVGYRLVCHLAETGLVSSVWTTNFDGLTARAAAAFDLTPVEIGIDSTHRVFRPRRAGELLCISLHGDYRYDALKNTHAEIQEQDANLRAALVTELNDSPLIVAGYSGRDASVMEAFNETYSRAGTGTLYWCGYGLTPPAPVSALIEAARANGRTAHYVPTDGFDSLLERLLTIA